MINIWNWIQMVTRDHTNQYTQEHFFGIAIFTIILIRLFQWLFASDGYAMIPRVYVSELSMWKRLTDYFRALLHAQEAVWKGYKMFPKSFFRIYLPGYGSGMVVVDHDHLKEFLDAPEDHVSFSAAFNDGFSLSYLFHGDVRDDYHTKIIRGKLTQNISFSIPALVDELNAFFDEDSEFKGILSTEYTPLVIHPKMTRMVQRLVQRVLLGLPFCRNPEYLERLSDHAAAAGLATVALRFVPIYLKSLAVRIMFPALSKGQKTAEKILAPIINERREMEKYGNNYQKPSDMIQWLMDAASGSEGKTENIVSRILMLNFGSSHTTTIQFMHALYSLAAYPEYIEPLREEIESQLIGGDWNKATISKMRKLDSFLRENFRLHPTGATGTQRLVIKPYTFTNGITVYPGTTLTSLVEPIHGDESIYQNPEKFDGFRFSRMEDTTIYSTTTSTEYLIFSHGEHACPGRFFAVNIIKLMLIFVLLRYDLKTKDGQRPKDFHVALARLPDFSAEILFRKRSRTKPVDPKLAPAYL